MNLFFWKKKPQAKKLIVAENMYLVSGNGEYWGPFDQDELFRRFQNSEFPRDAFARRGEGPWMSLASLFPEPEPEPEEIDLPTPEKLPQLGEKMVNCPHCWKKFPISQINYVSRHLDLIGDPVLGPEAQARFLPTSFNEQGYALDAKGLVCQEMACPHCHLKVPESCLDLPCSVFSIVGAPASGKSYYLTSMIWKLRSTLAASFDYSLTDTDETFNGVLNHYEQLLFLNSAGNKYVALPKTELQGRDFSNQIIEDGMVVDLPLPFIFTLTPLPANQMAQKGEVSPRNLILYDNAGEHFEPGRDQVTNQATQHLMLAESIAFLFDPLKDSRMAKKCNSADPQLSSAANSSNQLVLLNEMIARIRKYSGIRSGEKYSKPLVVIVPKYDAWRENFPLDLEKVDYIHYSTKSMSYSLEVGSIIAVSYLMRELLLETAPEVVAACEGAFSTVLFVPVSALGQIPEYDREREMIGIKPENLKPIWAEVPMLLQLWLAGLLAGVDGFRPEATLVENYRMNGETLVFSIPGQPGRVAVPFYYADHCIYSAKAGKYLRLPAVDAAASDVPAGPLGTTPSAQDAATDDFWKN